MCTARRTTWEEFLSEIVGAIFRNRSNRRNRQLSGLTNSLNPLRLHHTFTDECRGGSGESDQIDKWCSVVTTGTKPTLTKEQPITDRYTDRKRTR